MGRDTVQLETTVSTISRDYLLEFTSEYGISEALHLELPGAGERIVDFPEGKKQPEALLCLVGLSRRYFLGDEVYPTFLHDDDRGGYGLVQFDLCSKPYQDQGEEAMAPEVPPSENVTTTGVTPEAGPAEGIAATGPHMIKKRCKRGNDGVDTNAPPKVLRKDHADSRPTHSTHEGKSLVAMGLGMGSTRPVPASQGAHVDVSDPDPLYFADPQSRPTLDVAQSSKGAAVAKDLESMNTSFTSMAGSPESIYRSEWGVTNGCLLDAPEACQDLVDHIAPPGYFLELRHLHNDNFLKQYNVNLARQVVMGSQMRLRFEQEAKLLKKYVAQVACRDKRIQARENEIKNLETMLEVVTDMKKAAKGKSAELSKELEDLPAQFLDLQVSNNRLSQQVFALQAQVIGEEKLKPAFEKFKQYEDNQVEQHCAEMDVIGHGLHLAVMKYGESTELRHAFTNVVSTGIAKGMSEGLKHGVEHGKANLSMEANEAYDSEAEAKYITALYALKDLKYPIVDQLESLKDAPMDLIMASLHLESDTGDDAPQWIRKLRLCSSQLKIPVYPEARDPTDHWACKEDILLADAIATNVSRAEKKRSAEWYAVHMGSAPLITPGPMVFRYPCQPLLHKVLLSFGRMRLHKWKYLRMEPL
uniref:Transposase (Putative), gypsy type n=1 Tax=Tanacetum cinerariifolium TaxID=118510 RepID=A0A699H313_TANCI|nr:hypothetical protein [Tanacetum cinerariifolium]